MPAASRALPALLLALALVLTGCGREEGGSAASPSPSAAALPDGYREITGAKTGLTFGAPKNWLVIDATRLTEERRTAKRVAASLNLSLEQLKVQLASIDVLVMEPTTTGLTQRNLNLTPVPGQSELPSEEVLRAELGRINADVDRITDVSTPVGPGRLVQYTIMNDELTAGGSAVYVEAESGLAALTATAGSPKAAQKMMDQSLPTLQQQG